MSMGRRILRESWGFLKWVVFLGVILIAFMHALQMVVIFWIVLVLWFLMSIVTRLDEKIEGLGILGIQQPTQRGFAALFLAALLINYDAVDTCFLEPYQSAIPKHEDTYRDAELINQAIKLAELDYADGLWHWIEWDGEYLQVLPYHNSVKFNYVTTYRYFSQDAGCEQRMRPLWQIPIPFVPPSSRNSGGTPRVHITDIIKNDPLRFHNSIFPFFTL